MEATNKNRGQKLEEYKMFYVVCIQQYGNARVCVGNTVYEGFALVLY